MYTQPAPDRERNIWSIQVTVGFLGNRASRLSGHFYHAKGKVWFAGDTGYRAVKDGMDEDTAPRCPAFEEIGVKFGGFDLALIPIGWVLFFLSLHVWVD